jgi:hypothetical protein
MKVVYANRRAYVIEDYSDSPAIGPGSEILAVDGIPAPEMINRFLQTLASDGPNETFRYHHMNLKPFGLFPGYPEFPDSYVVTYRTPGDSSRKSETVAAKHFDRPSYLRWESFGDMGAGPPIEFTTIDSLNTALLTVRTFSFDPGTDFAGRFHEAFRAIRDRSLKNLILDLRANDGGGPEGSTELLSYLMTEEFVYFKPQAYGYRSLKRPVKLREPGFRGNLYILIDGGCFSTTGHFLSLVKYHNLATLIGEESGGSAWCNGGNKIFTLPNTGLRLQCTRCIYETAVSGFPRGRGVMPDIGIRPTIDDLVAGRDPVMLHALGLARAAP